MPAPSWTDTFNDDTEWDYADFVNLFVNAIRQRKQAIGQSTSGLVDLVVDDDELGTATFWAGLQTAVNSLMTASGNGWLKDIDDPETATLTSLDRWVGTDMRSHLGHGSNFRRRRPREITSTSATTDTMSNTVAAGMKAILTSGTNAQRVHEYTGSTWFCFGTTRNISTITRVGTTATAQTTTSHGLSVGDIVLIAGQAGYNGERVVRSTPTASTFTFRIRDNPTTPQAGGTCKFVVPGPPDALDSTLAAPYTMPAGTMQSGDYIGHWIFTELRDILRHLRWSLHNGNWSSRQRRRGASTNMQPSILSAVAAAQADFSAASWASSAGTTLAVYNGTWQSSIFPGNYQCEVVRHRATVSITLPTFCERKAVFIVRPRALNWAGFNSNRVTYDDQGDGLTEDEWHVFGTEGPNTTGTLSKEFLPGDTFPPVYEPAPPADGNFRYHGYQFAENAFNPDSPSVVVKWDVSGGFDQV